MRLLNGGRKKDVSQRNLSKSIDFSNILADPKLNMDASDPSGVVAFILAEIDWQKTWSWPEITKNIAERFHQEIVTSSKMATADFFGFSASLKA